MKITLCGSARFEDEFKDANKRLSLAGHVVYSLAVFPSDESGKNWYTPKQKETLDRVHKLKIKNSEAILVICPEGYIGDSTQSEITYTMSLKGMKIYFDIEEILRKGVVLCSLDTN